MPKFTQPATSFTTNFWTTKKKGRNVVLTVHDVVVAREAVGPVLLDFRSDPTYELTGAQWAFQK